MGEMREADQQKAGPGTEGGAVKGPGSSFGAGSVDARKFVELDGEPQSPPKKRPSTNPKKPPIEPAKKSEETVKQDPKLPEPEVSQIPASDKSLFKVQGILKVINDAQENTETQISNSLSVLKLKGQLYFRYKEDPQGQWRHVNNQDETILRNDDGSKIESVSVISNNGKQYYHSKDDATKHLLFSSPKEYFDFLAVKQGDASKTVTAHVAEGDKVSTVEVASHGGQLLTKKEDSILFKDASGKAYLKEGGAFAELSKVELDSSLKSIKEQVTDRLATVDQKENPVEKRALHEKFDRFKNDSGPTIYKHVKGGTISLYDQEGNILASVKSVPEMDKKGNPKKGEYKIEVSQDDRTSKEDKVIVNLEGPAPAGGDAAKPQTAKYELKITTTKNGSLQAELSTNASASGVREALQTIGKSTAQGAQGRSMLGGVFGAGKGILNSAKSAMQGYHKEMTGPAIILE